MRALRTVGLVAVATAVLGVGAAGASVPYGWQPPGGRAAAAAPRHDRNIQGEVTDVRIAGCDWGTCVGTLSLWRDGAIQTVEVTPATRITSAGRAMPLGEVRPGESVTVTGYN
jgi:hypothetical protein